VISVIIPCFNRVDSIALAIDSVLAQELDDDYEVIVVDDGSTDRTRELIHNRYPQVSYLRQANKGVSAARNLGLENAKGEWIALLDSDDQWLPGKLAAQMEALAKSRLKLCHTQEIWIRNGVRVNQMNKHAKAGGWIYPNCLPLCAISPSSVVLHKSVFESLGNFDESLPACEDYDLWLRVCAQYEVAYIDTPLIKKFGGHPDQLSRKYWGMDRFRVIALAKMLAGAELKQEQREQTKAMLLKKLKILQTGAIKHGNTSLAEECRLKLAHYENLS